jgi:phage terminase large subunit-like protein
VTATEAIRSLPKPVIRELFDRTIVWRTRARPEQLPPSGQWRTWYVRGGRGSGKTWTGSNVLSDMAKETVGDYGVVAPTFADMRDKCVEGPSGLLVALGTNKAEVRRGASRQVEAWNRSLGELRLRNGSVIHGDGADDGAPTIQGYNLRGAWADEVGLWKQWKMAWEESLRYAVRLSPARIVATGTPKRGHPLVKVLMHDETVEKTLLLTLDNAANLDPLLLAELIEKYAGTTVGRQELEGEILDDVPGALWRRELIRYRPAPLRLWEGKAISDLARVVVAIDPAVSAGEDSDETGIVVDGLGHDGNGYTIADVSLRALPAAWARVAVDAYYQHSADRIVAEANNGGEMVREVIRAVDSKVPVTLVHASRGKTTRAEPIATVYEQGKWFHVEPFPDLEDQQCSYTGAPGEKSPDRMDAHVWAASELLGLSATSAWSTSAW